MCVYAKDDMSGSNWRRAAMIAEYNASSALLRRFLHGPGIDEPIVWYEGSDTSDRRFLVADDIGSIVAVTDAAGALTNTNTYDEFGRPGGSNAGRFQYTGQMWLAEAGLYHYRARAYSPVLGRFLQTDPILFAGGMNLYAYVDNDPVNLTDPTGLDAWLILRPVEAFGGSGYHAFVLVADCLGCTTEARFSFGPTFEARQPVPFALTALQDTRRRTDIDDAAAIDDARFGRNGVIAIRIRAPDATVIHWGRLVSQFLGKPSQFNRVPYNPWPRPWQIEANSNTAAYLIANLSQADSGFGYLEAPPVFAPGWESSWLTPRAFRGGGGRNPIIEVGDIQPH